jgi:eukaryotic-like serine/threonine-protein kinase
MSPEQALGKRVMIDQRADVYSLGVTLYELLTRRPAFDGCDRQELLRQIAFEEPSAPRRIDPAIPRELETVVLKAVAKEPEGRYASAQELADDLRRFLEHRPIRARRPTLMERAAKWSRRHQPVVVSAVVLLAMAVAGLTVSNAMISRRNAEIVLKNKEVARQRDAAIKAQAETKRALDETAEARNQAEAVSRFLVDAFRRPDPDQDGRELKVLDLLISAASKLDAEFAGPPRIKGELLNALGLTFFGLGQPAQAAEMHEKARAVREATLGPDHPDTLSSRNNLAEAYLLAGRTAEALTLCESTLKVRESWLGSDHPDTLNSQNNLAMAYKMMGDLARAVPLLERTLEAMKSKLGRDHHSTLTTQNNLASALSDAGRTAEAIALFKATLALRESSLAPDHPYTLQSRNNLAFALTNAGRTAESIPLIEATLKQRESKLGSDHPNTITSRNNLAAAYAKAGRPDRALPLFELVLKQSAAKFGSDHPRTLQAQANLGIYYSETGHREEGARLMEEALRRGQGNPDAKTALTRVPANLAAAYDALGQFARSEPIYRERVAKARKSFGAEDYRTALEMFFLGWTLLKQQKWSEAEPICRPCLTILEKTHPDTVSTFIARSQLGDSLLGQAKFAEAEPLIVSGYVGLRSREATIPPKAKPRLTEAAERVVRLYEQWGRPGEAAAWKARISLENLDVLMPKGAAAFAR